MGAHRRDLGRGFGAAQQVVTNQQARLGNDDQRRGQEKVERPGNDAFGRVFDRNDAEVGTAGSGRAKHLVDAGTVDRLDRRAEEAERRLLAEGACRPEKGDACRRFECAARRHDLAPDRCNAALQQRSCVVGFPAGDDLRLALGPERGRALPLLQLADLMGEVGPLVEQRQQLAVDAVDTGTQVGELARRQR